MSENILYCYDIVSVCIYGFSFCTDILFRLDSDGRPIAIPEELRMLKPYQDILRPTGDGWRCVVVANRNMYMFNVPRLVGEATTKLRQLRLLGYTPIVVSNIADLGLPIYMCYVPSLRNIGEKYIGDEI